MRRTARRWQPPVWPFALDGAEDAALLSGEEDTKRIGGIVVAISFVDIGALDLVACEPFGSFDDGDQRVAAVRIARQPCPFRCTRPRERGRSKA
jgi:hypothetical protein